MAYANGKQALQHVDLTLEAPSLIGLLGPNGAGKSTLMKLLVSALVPTGGDILIDAAIDQSTTGQLVQDFVLTNLHDLRIWGDDKSSTVNINGMVLYSPDSASRNVVVKLNGAKAVADGGKISVSPSKAISGFVIRNK